MIRFPEMIRIVKTIEMTHTTKRTMNIDDERWRENLR
jgi:hypothetical protein